MIYLNDMYCFKYSDFLQAIARSMNINGFSEYSSADIGVKFALKKTSIYVTCI